MLTNTVKKSPSEKHQAMSWTHLFIFYFPTNQGGKCRKTNVLMFHLNTILFSERLRGELWHDREKIFECQ